MTSDQAQHLDRRFEKMEENFKESLGEFDRRLFGNGQPGELDKIKTRLTTLERFMWLGIGGIMVMQFLSGSGLFSLSSLKAILGH